MGVVCVSKTPCGWSNALAVVEGGEGPGGSGGGVKLIESLAVF